MDEHEAAEQRGVDEVIDRLAEKYPRVDRAEIANIVGEEHLAFAGKPVRAFVPVLVEKSARKRVKKLDRGSE